MNSIRATQLEKFQAQKGRVRYGYKKGNKIFIQCSCCKEVKELTVNNFYKNKECYLGFSARCKECHKAYREQNKGKRKITDSLYYIKNKEKLKKHQREYSKTIRGKESHKRTRNMKKHYIRIKTQKYILQNGLRPNICSICGKEGNIQAHHIDYNERNKIVFCCESCHGKIHSGLLQQYNVVDILLINKTNAIN